MLFVRKHPVSGTAPTPADIAQDAAVAPEDTPSRAAPGGLFVDTPPPSKARKGFRFGWSRAGRAAEPSVPEATDTASDDTPDAAAPESPKAEAHGRWRFWRRTRHENAEAPSRERPIRVLMGFLPGVTARDATEFALGVAEKNFDQPGIAFYDAFAFEDGYVYEVHEGGPGKAYAPDVIRYFKTLPPFAPGEAHAVVLPTATRSVRIERTRGGLQTVLLPESNSQSPSEGFAGTTKMRPAVSKRTGLLVSGAALFVTGFFGLLFSLIARIPTYDAPPVVTVERVDYGKLPLAQWPRLASVPPTRYVKALRFEKGSWRVEDAPIEEAGTAENEEKK